MFLLAAFLNFYLLILFIKGVCACVCFRNNETETHQVIKQLVYLGQRQSWDLNYSCLATGLQLFLPALGRSYPARAEQRKSPPTGQRPPANLKLILPSLRLRTLYRILFFFFFGLNSGLNRFAFGICL